MLGPISRALCGGLALCLLPVLKLAADTGEYEAVGAEHTKQGQTEWGILPC